MLTKFRRMEPEYTKAYCKCFTLNDELLPNCHCGEHQITEWLWDDGQEARPWIKIYPNKTQVIFHPSESLGTSIVRGNTCFNHGYIYYWEVKMMTEPFGTDIMIGVGSENINIIESANEYCSFLGQDGESYGLSYTGSMTHMGAITKYCEGFGWGTIVGVKVDMWQGTLEFFLNRVGQGISYNTLRKHLKLFPMASSTALQSVIRLVYAKSWKASLLVTAGKVLANSVHKTAFFDMFPPGLSNFLESHFYIMLPSCEHLMEDKHGSSSQSLKCQKQREKYCTRSTAQFNYRNLNPDGPTDFIGNRWMEHCINNLRHYRTYFEHV